MGQKKIADKPQLKTKKYGQKEVISRFEEPTLSFSKIN